jgi:hypothetical protein
MIWQRDHMVRRVFMTDKHSANIKPQSFGDSIGHYENGDTLVVDTIGLATKNNFIDNFRTPHTGEGTCRRALHHLEGRQGADRRGHGRRCPTRSTSRST